MKTRLPLVGVWVLMALLAVAPAVAGKIWVWQALLVALLLGLGAALYLAGRVREEGEGKGLDAVDWALVVFLALQGATWFWSVYRFATAVYMAKVLAFALAFWLCRYGLKGEKQWRTAVWAVIGGGILLGVVGLREYVRTAHILGDTSWRVFGTMFNPNVAAGYLLLTVFPAVAMLLGAGSRKAETPSEAEATATATATATAKATAKAKAGAEAKAGSRKGNSKGSRAVADDRTGERSYREAEAETAPEPRYAEIAAGFAVLLMFLTVLLTGSKAALAALLVGGVVFALVAFGQDRAGKRARLAVLAAVGLTVLAAFTLPPIRERLVSAFGWQSHSSVFRWYTWQGTLQMIAARPLLGFGGGTFEHVFPQYAVAAFTRQAHQAFLQLVAECGLPALVAGLVFGVLVLRGLWQVTRRETVVLRRLVAAAALTGLVGSALQQLVDYAWYIPAVGLTFSALAGLGLGPGEGAAIAESKRRRRLVWAGLVLAALLALWSGKDLYAEVLGGKGDAFVAGSAYEAANEAFASAARLNPGQARFWVQMSKIQEGLAQRDPQAHQRAIEARQRAIALQPTEPLNYLALARLHEAAGENQRALAAAQEAVRRYPNYPRGWAQVAQLQAKLGQDPLPSYQRVVDLYNSPVGQHPPVAGMLDTAFVRGWMGLGDDLWQRGGRQEALLQYYQAARFLREALDLQVATQADVGAGESPWGHLAEDTLLAGEVEQRLLRDNRALSVMLMARLRLVLRQKDEARDLLRFLADGKAEAKLPADRLARAWGTLRLAEEMAADKQGDAGAVAKRGLQQAQEAQGAEAAELERQGWTAQETGELERVKRVVARVK